MSRRWRVAIMVGIALAIPTVVEAHVISGAGGWADELICAVPAMVLLGVVLVLGRDDKKVPDKPPTDEKDEG